MVAGGIFAVSGRSCAPLAHVKPRRSPLGVVGVCGEISTSDPYAKLSLRRQPPLQVGTVEIGIDRAFGRAQTRQRNPEHVLVGLATLVHLVLDVLLAFGSDALTSFWLYHVDEYLWVCHLLISRAAPAGHQSLSQCGDHLSWAETLIVAVKFTSLCVVSPPVSLIRIGVRFAPESWRIAMSEVAGRRNDEFPLPTEAIESIANSAMSCTCGEPAITFPRAFYWSVLLG